MVLHISRNKLYRMKFGVVTGGTRLFFTHNGSIFYGETRLNKTVPRTYINFEFVFHYFDNFLAVLFYAATWNRWTFNEASYSKHQFTITAVVIIRFWDMVGVPHNNPTVKCEYMPVSPGRHWLRWLKLPCPNYAARIKPWCVHLRNFSIFAVTTVFSWL